MAKHIVFIVLLFRSVISIAQSSSWTELGPFDTPELRSSFSGRQGIGRTSCIRFDTDFQNTGNLYLGSPLGGLWKLTCKFLTQHKTIHMLQHEQV